MTRTLNYAERTAGLPELIVCPHCEGQAYDRGNCGLCGNCGYLGADNATRLRHVEQVQILATFSLATGIQLAGGAAPATETAEQSIPEQTFSGGDR